MLNLNFPALAANAFSALPRPERLRASIFLERAARNLSFHTPAPLDGCLTASNCLPVRGRDSRLCLLCAVDAAVGRYSNGVDHEIWIAYCQIGTVAKQAAVDTLEANPDVDPARDAEDVCLILSSRLHNDQITAETVAEQSAAALESLCYRSLERPGFGGRVIQTEERVEAELVRRGWAVGGYITPAGRHAAELRAIALRHAKQARTAAGQPS